MAFSGPLEDRIAIQELNASYADTISAGELEEWNGLWAEEAVWDHPRFGHLVGRKEIAAMGVKALAALPFVQYAGLVGRIEIEGDRARGRVWVTEYTSRKDGGHFRVSGVYDDQYVKGDGRWLFLERRYAYRQRAIEEPVDG